MSSTTRTAFTAFIGLLALTDIAMTTRAETRRPKVDRLVMRSAGSYGESKLSIDLKSGRAKLYVFGIGVMSREGAPPTDRTRIVERELPFSEAQDLRRLAVAADLFKGETAGIELDLSYAIIEAHARGEVSVAVVTGNQSFQSGPREELVHQLVVEGSRLLGEK
jgi:hypothetical protein